MTEEFLHYLWKFRLLFPNLRLVTGETVDIIDPGVHNTDSGPDFFNARIRIGETLWAGNIELHLRSSGWIVHRHHHDKAYDNIILHVVHEHDRDIVMKNGQPVPTLEINKSYPHSVYDRYSDFMSSRHWIACEKMIHLAERFVVNNWIDRLLAERLEFKATEILAQLSFSKNNWEQTFYEVLARNFGFKVNTLPFDLLAKSLPLNFLAKHKDNLLQIEAMLFGQAGLIPQKPADDYSRKLRTEYDFLRKKYRLIPMDPHLWRFMRLRPSNFPTVRIAQFAGLVHCSTHLLSQVIESKSLKELTGLFGVSVSAYWKDHFRFGKKTVMKEKKLGKDSVNLLLINTVIPFIFVYGHSHGDGSLTDRSLRFLDQIPGESNRITRKWEALGMSCRAASATQALLHLKSEYCTRKKCLECSIGNHLLKQVQSSNDSLVV